MGIDKSSDKGASSYNGTFFVHLWSWVCKKNRLAGVASTKDSVSHETSNSEKEPEFREGPKMACELI